MAGRGRGRQSSSLTQEQLQVLGCIGKDVPVGTTAPPPTFPSLLNRPVPLEISTANDYMILWKEDFLTFMRESPYYLESKIPSNKGNKNIQRYSDQFVNALESSKEKSKADIPWQLMPAELKPNWIRRKALAAAGTQIVKKKKTVQVIEDRLKKLEQKEKTSGDSDVEKPKNRSRPNRIESDSDDDREDDEIGQDEDEEMDEENDYGNNYFDNGETFNEEDDNLDDGPTY